MKRSHLGIVVLVVLCASLWVVATNPLFSQMSFEPTEQGEKP